MNELEQYVQSYFGIPREDLQKIVSLFKEDELKKDHFFLKSGGFGTKISFVKSGYLRVFASTEEKDITQWISGKGYFVTDLASLIFNSPARWNIQAITDCKLYSISGEDYRKIGELIPQWHKLEGLFLAKCFMTLEDRVFSFLSMTAEARYRALFAMDKGLFNEVPLNYLASMLGMTPETFSRIRRKMIS